MRKMEHHSGEIRLRELGLFNLEKRDGFVVAFQCLKGIYRKNGTTYRTMLPQDKGGTGSNTNRFRLDIKKKKITGKVVRHWNKLPREAESASSLQVFEARLDGAWSNVV